MAVVKNLMVRAGADFSGMRREMEKANKNLREFKTGMNSTLKGIAGALATIGIGAVLKGAVKSAMDVESSMQQINRTMGTSAQAFIDWASNGAAAYNLAKSDALKYGQVYSNLTSLFSASTAETMTRTQDLLKTTGVIASSTGRDMTDVMERVRSGMLGNTEAIEDLGIYVNIAMIESTKAFKQFANGKHWDQLDFQTQQQIRYFAILEQSTRKFGTAINDNANSRTAQFVAQLKNIQLGLGQAFLPIWNAVLPALTRMAAALASVMNVVAQFTQALFGKSDTKAQTQATKAQSGAVTGLGNAYKAAGKAAKGAVAGFDEVNTLADSSGSAGSGASPLTGLTDSAALGGVATATQKVSDKVREMANKVKSAFSQMSSFIKDHKDIILAALAALAAGFTAFYVLSNLPAIVTAVRTAMAGLALALGAVSLPVLLVAAAIALLVGAFVYFYRTSESFRDTVKKIWEQFDFILVFLAGVVAGFIYLYTTNEKFRGVVDGILRAIGEAAKWLWNQVLVPFGKWLADVLPKAWDTVTIAAEWFWKNVLVPLGNFLLWMWNNVFLPIGGVLIDVLGVAFKTVSDIAQAFWVNVLMPLGAALSEMFAPAVEAVSAVLTFLLNNVFVPFGNFIDAVFKPIWSALADAFVFLWNNVLKPFATYIGGVFYIVFDNIFKGMGTIIGGLKTTFIGLMNFITGVFTGDWDKAWNGVKTIFKGVFDSLWGIAKTPLNMIIDAINKVIEGLNKISVSLPDVVGGGTIGVNIPKIPKLAKGGITNGPMMAMIGDNPGGQEVVSPLDGLLDMIQSAVGTAVLAAAHLSGGGDKHGDVYLDSTIVGRVLAPLISKENSRTGAPMITTAGASTIITT